MKITLVPAGGLCNRINAITSAICYKEKRENIDLQLYWEKTPECYADFSDLFNPLEDYKIERINKFYLLPRRKRNLYLSDILKKFIFDGIYYNAPYGRMNFDSVVRNKKNIYVSAANAFTPFEITSSLGKYFVPIDQLQERINQIVALFDDNTIGIHIRRTDNIDAIKNNPLNKFTALMDKEISQNKDVLFYLATDSQEVKDYLKKQYGERIISMPILLTRNALQGMQDAVVDLYCLGSTKKIIGCTNSTYSITASHLFNIDLIL